MAVPGGRAGRVEILPGNVGMAARRKAVAGRPVPVVEILSGNVGMTAPRGRRRTMMIQIGAGGAWRGRRVPVRASAGMEADVDDMGGRGGFGRRATGTRSSEAPKPHRSSLPRGHARGRPGGSVRLVHRAPAAGS